MHGHGKSDSSIVPKTKPNKAMGASTAEASEGRELTKGNTPQDNRHRTQSRVRLQQALERVRQVAVQDRTARFTSLWHLVCDIDRLREAFFKIKRQSAAGIDGETRQEYEKWLDENLADLSARLQRSAYHAKPVKRVYIPKADGRKRPIGIPALEDKIVQRATAEVLGAIYETDFHEFSYGFRPGRSQHLALDTLATAIDQRPLNWVLDADIRGFFDNIDHEWLLKYVKHRIADPRILHHIQKWLQAGVFEDGETRVDEYGTPQGGSISPLLANIYLHYAFDNWAAIWSRKEARGQMLLVRFADDVVVCFEHREDAERFLAGMRERLGRFHLELNMEKTHLLAFGRNAQHARHEQAQQQGDERAPQTFDFLGFTHYCGHTRKGWFVTKRQTARKKMQSKLREVRQELRRRLHAPVPEVGQWLGRMLQGHYQYYGVPFNFKKLSAFRNQVLWHWKRSLARRSQKAKDTWERAEALAARYLPRPRIVHPYPNKRLGVMT